MKNLVIYIHGKGGNAEEAKHYRPLFTDSDVVGFDYRSQTPWEAKEELSALYDSHAEGYDSVTLIANSIGGYFAMNALAEKKISRALLISPIVDMEKLIKDMMARANVTESELKKRREIPTDFGETLSWEYLRYAQKHPLEWEIPTHILYGEKDNLTSVQTVSEFASRIGGTLTVMKGGEHWFHTEEQIRFLDGWIKEKTNYRGKNMDKNNVIIRLEKKEEYREVENLVRESFWNVYRPGCLEHYVLHQLRNDPAFVSELDFVMEKDGKLIGQNMFMRANIKADDGRDIPIMTMGPICITPALKRKGYGKKLLDYSLEKAKELGCGALCFEGDIAFYGKSGFTYASDFGIRYHGLPEGEDASFFLCKELIPGYLDGITGEYATPQGYLVDETEAKKFDESFPPKQI